MEDEEIELKGQVGGHGGLLAVRGGTGMHPLYLMWGGQAV